MIEARATVLVLTSAVRPLWTSSIRTRSCDSISCRSDFMRAVGVGIVVAFRRDTAAAGSIPAHGAAPSLERLARRNGSKVAAVVRAQSQRIYVEHVGPACPCMPCLAYMASWGLVEPYKAYMPYKACKA